MFGSITVLSLKIYNIAASLHELLTLSKPFGANHMQLRAKKIEHTHVISIKSIDPNRQKP
tara:strand:- start:2932 stop:3111 length:180 start_codon:yes stop_codon:yes gene_type:complete